MHHQTSPPSHTSPAPPHLRHLCTTKPPHQATLRPLHPISAHLRTRNNWNPFATNFKIGTVSWMMATISGRQQTAHHHGRKAKDVCDKFTFSWMGSPFVLQRNGIWMCAYSDTLVILITIRVWLFFFPTKNPACTVLFSTVWLLDFVSFAQAIWLLEPCMVNFLQVKETKFVFIL